MMPLCMAAAFSQPEDQVFTPSGSENGIVAVFLPRER